MLVTGMLSMIPRQSKHGEQFNALWNFYQTLYKLKLSKSRHDDIVSWAFKNKS